MITRALPWWLGLAACTLGCDASVSAWSVRAGFLRAPDGRAAILRGVNLSGSQKSAPYLDDKTPSDYARVRDDWGMNGIRFVMTWAAIEPEEGRYDERYLDGVAERLRWAEESGLWVVLDMHQDVYGEGFGFDGAPRWTCSAERYAAFVPQDPWFLSVLDPNVIACVDEFYLRTDRRQRFVDAWRHVAERFAEQKAVVGFDVLNEPSWGSAAIADFERERLAPLYEDVVEAVRGAAPGWVAFLEPSASRNIGFDTGLRPFSFPNVVYAPHSYDAGAERGNGFEPSHRPQILEQVQELAAEARMLGAALWIGEYGGVASAPGITEYMTAEYDAIGQVAAGSMYWAYDKSDGYGMLTPEGEEKTALLDALVRPYPERVAGDPISYAFDPATSAFTLRYAPDLTLALPTEISVPARSYPGGYDVECGGCRFQVRSGALIIEDPGAVEPVTVVITKK